MAPMKTKNKPATYLITNIADAPLKIWKHPAAATAGKTENSDVFQ
ncbi:MAG: hypothetical protein NWE96_10765 [Candidatus Bathyarchaeota archaeon]|nr:hypothetical protein [Candidatus Bathyarchaeota archaeon]